VDGLGGAHPPLSLAAVPAPHRQHLLCCLLFGTSAMSSSSTSNRLSANLYRVPPTQLGDDPAQYLVSAGFTHVTLVAGEKRNIEIDAKNFTGMPIVAIDFSVTGE
jgi:hypothetical protein